MFFLSCVCYAFVRVCLFCLFVCLFGILDQVLCMIVSISDLYHLSYFVVTCWEGLTSWLSFVVSNCELSLSHWYPGSGVVLDCIDS